VAGNQTNGNACTKESIDVGKASPKNSDDDVTDDAGKKSTKDTSNEGEKDDQDLRDEFERLFVQGKEAKININSTNSISAISSPINTAGIKDTDDEPMMPNLEDTGIFGDAYDDEDFVAGGDMNNLEYSMSISPIATSVHKDHPDEQIIRDLHSEPQTRRMTKNSEEHSLGYTQEEEIDYDDVFATVARIEAIRLFLAYASFKDFVVYQMDVKSAFLYGKIEEEVYVCQPLGFEDPEFPDRVYKVEKALYGLHQAPRACQDKYVDEILKKFGFSTVKTASTPMETSKPLMKDENAEDVNVHLYRSMIGSLMYLTSSRPDIMFVVCACARFQVTPKVSHLHAVKRIFRYLKGQPKLGLWYPKDSPFDLEAYTDSDYAGASLDRKSTTGGCQFLRSRLISWQCKKQTVVANSTTEAEYVAASNCCGQVLWIQNQLLDYGYNFMNTKIFIDNESTICIVKNLVFHSKTKHIEIRHHFIRDFNEKKLIQMIKIHTDQNVADLLTKAFDQIIHKGWLKWNATTAEDGIEVKTGNSKVNAAGHYLVLLGIT
ncbi:putative reverse transcriptase, RNA-dependent DNA polymerase, partial [Tanacetum coccineum]